LISKIIFFTISLKVNRKPIYQRSVFLKKIAIALIICFALIAAPSPFLYANAGNGSFAHYSGWQNLTEKEKLCFVLGYGYGAQNISVSLTPPLNFVRQIDLFFENGDFQIFPVEDLFRASNWLFLGYPEEKINTYLQLKATAISGQKISIEELHLMETLEKEAEDLEKEITEKLENANN